MNGTILVVDDESEIVDVLSDIFSDRDYKVLKAYNGEQALDHLKTQVDLVILDIMMPKMDGFEFCKVVREQIKCPILFLSAKHSEIDKVKGFTLGGDDYITKPFQVRELIARVEAHLRREKRERVNLQNQRFLGNLTINYSQHDVFIDGVKIDVTSKEFKILELLTVNLGQIFSKEQIYEKIWGLDAVGDLNTIIVHINNLRAKLSLGMSTYHIKTVWGVGYKLEKC
ncbi:response regulator transcription factor [Bacillus nitratireducens]|uniref:response regulator transcription factor n=1 Tax=Bacillus nitratireducens TaxID=2026193 RepID=UPI0008FE12FE|nr:response regulator transcription factor [Bacillus nitratireducens]OJD39317.1 DNA-binding response regulator [Bacillus nitratireducens]